jgi:hypothetical protein
MVDRESFVSSATGSNQVVVKRAAGLVGNANSLAFFAITSLLACLCFFFAFRSAFVKFMALALMPVMCMMVAASGSRKGLLGLALVAAGVYVFHLRRTGQMHGALYRVGAFFVGVLVAIGAVYYISTTPFFSRLEESMSTVSQLQHESRYHYFINAMQATAEHPILGLGLQGFTMAGLSGFAGHYSHSTIAESLSCTGIPGFILVYWSLVSMFYLVYRTRKLHLERADLAVVNMCYLFIIFFILFGIAAVTLSDRLAWPLIGAFCGYLRNLRSKVDLFPQPA